jgi:hypothetical protein
MIPWGFDWSSQDHSPKTAFVFYFALMVVVGGWGVGSAAYLRDMSGRCIVELAPFHFHFALQFNCALTEGNYLQLFLGPGGGFVLPSIARAGGGCIALASLGYF